MPRRRKRADPRYATPSELAQIVRCERKFVYRAALGARDNPYTARRRREGDIEHARHDREVKQFARQSEDRRCFVASAVYGANAPETRLLRQYRDQVLRRTWLGRRIIQGYYRIGPTLAAWVVQYPGVSRRMRRMLSAKVLPWVRRSLP